MATGRLGAIDVASTTNTTVYTCPTDTYTVATISLCNRSASSVNIRLAISDTSTPSAAEYIEYDTPIPANNVFERTGVVLSNSQNIVVYSSGADVSAVVFGFETSTV